MEILILAVLIGLIPAVIAKNKGHSFVAWWLFGAALFIVALPAAILIKPDVGAVEQSKLSEGMKKCPFCAELIKPEATVCRYCGRELQRKPSLAEQEPAPRSPMQTAPPAPPPALRAVAPPPVDVFLHYGDQQHGPFAVDVVRKMRSDGIVPDDAFFWRDGLSDWLPISELERNVT